MTPPANPDSDSSYSVLGHIPQGQYRLKIVGKQSPTDNLGMEYEDVGIFVMVEADEARRGKWKPINEVFTEAEIEDVDFVTKLMT